MTTAVITGVGVVSAFGVGTQVFFDGLAEGRSAIGPIRSFDASSFPTRVAGEVPLDTPPVDNTFSLPFKGRVGVGMGFTAATKPHPTPHEPSAKDEGRRMKYEENPGVTLPRFMVPWAGLEEQGALHEPSLCGSELVREAVLHPSPNHHSRTSSLLRPQEGSCNNAILDHYEHIGAFRDRKVVFGLLAALEAWNSAHCGEAEQGASLSVALGLEQAFLEDFAPIFSNGKIDWKAESQLKSGNIRFRSHVGLCAELLGQLLNLRGPSFVNASACAAGGLAIAQAASLIRRGAASIVLCGGADSMVNPLGIGGMTRLGAPSPRNEPDACRPFDRRRDGLVIGEGAAMFVVESEERALHRGVKPLARILGWGSTQDAYRVTAPRPDGSSARNAMVRALTRAELPPEAVGYINAHGTGTLLNDPAEAKAIRDVFGAHADNLPVSSIKGAVGHLMAASGAIELAACLLPFQRNVLSGTAHHREKDPICDINVIGERPVETSVDVVLSNSFGFGGQNATLILGKCA